MRLPLSGWNGNLNKVFVIINLYIFFYCLIMIFVLIVFNLFSITPSEPIAYQYTGYHVNSLIMRERARGLLTPLYNARGSALWIIGAPTRAPLRYTFILQG